MSARTVATDTRSLRYVLAELSEVVAVATFVIVFLFFAFTAENFLTHFLCPTFLPWPALTGL